jgi:hypothetical protein
LCTPSGLATLTAPEPPFSTAISQVLGSERRDAKAIGGESLLKPKRWALLVATGEVACARCGELTGPDEPFDLGHVDGT